MKKSQPTERGYVAVIANHYTFMRWAHDHPEIAGAWNGHRFERAININCSHAVDKLRGIEISLVVDLEPVGLLQPDLKTINYMLRRSQARATR